MRAGFGGRELSGKTLRTLTLLWLVFIQVFALPVQGAEARCTQFSLAQNYCTDWPELDAFHYAVRFSFVYQGKLLTARTTHQCKLLQRPVNRLLQLFSSGSPGRPIPVCDDYEPAFVKTPDGTVVAFDFVFDTVTGYAEVKNRPEGAHPYLVFDHVENRRQYNFHIVAGFPPVAYLHPGKSGSLGFQYTAYVGGELGFKTVHPGLDESLWINILEETKRNFPEERKIFKVIRVELIFGGKYHKNQKFPMYEIFNEARLESSSKLWLKKRESSIFLLSEETNVDFFSESPRYE